MTKIAGYFSLLLVAPLLAVILSVAPSQAHPWAYSYVHYSNKGTPRIINVQCHSNGQWRGIGPGQNSKQVCAQNGWVDRIWVDSDVVLKVQPIGSSTVGSYGQGYNGWVFPGDYNVWVLKVVGA